jgi:F0F1-type ATP synthase assembly protein I
MTRVEASQRRELTQQMHQSTGSYELVLSPLILALIGFGLDHLFGTLPWLTIVFGTLGLVGACVKIYIGYVYEMDEHEKGKPWAKRS